MLCFLRESTTLLCELISHEPLNIIQRITFQLVVLVYRCLHGLAPSYLVAKVHRVTDVNPQRRLPALIVRLTLHSSIGDR